MTRRKPSEYDWPTQRFDERILTKHITSPRRSKVKFIIAHHMTVVGDGKGKGNNLCYSIWQNREASAHYGVDGDHVMQFVWDNNAAWATGNGNGNHAGISIEHANSTAGPRWEISEKTWKTGAKLAAWLHVTHKLGRPVGGETLRRHRDFFATACPGPFMDSIWSRYVAEAQRVYDLITKGETKPVVKRWHEAAFLNVWGDDGGRGSASFDARLPHMVDDITEGRPEVIGFCEVREDQEPALTKAMRAEGYRLAAHSHRLALYVLNDVTVGKTSFARYAKQNKGAVEGVLRARLKVNGSWVHYAVTHLDYRDGFDQGRVTQMKQGLAALKRYTVGYWRAWTGRSVILTDANSKTWVTDKAMIPAGFKVAVAAVIDFIYVGKTRDVIDSAVVKTDSDHPIVRATLGRK